MQIIHKFKHLKSVGDAPIWRYIKYNDLQDFTPALNKADSIHLNNFGNCIVLNQLASALDKSITSKLACFIIS